MGIPIRLFFIITPFEPTVINVRTDSLHRSDCQFTPHGLTVYTVRTDSLHRTDCLQTTRVTHSLQAANGSFLHFLPLTDLRCIYIGKDVVDF